MVGLLHQMQRRRLAQPLDDGFEQVKFRQRIARPLQEQHGDPDVGEMLRPVAGRFSRRVQRKAEEREPAHAGQRLDRLRLRRHAAAERFAARDQRQSGAASRGFADRRPHRGVSDGRRIRAACCLFPCRETDSAASRCRGRRALWQSSPSTHGPCRRRRHAQTRNSARACGGSISNADTGAAAVISILSDCAAAAFKSAIPRYAIA